MPIYSCFEHYPRLLAAHVAYLLVIHYHSTARPVATLQAWIISPELLLRRVSMIECPGRDNPLTLQLLLVTAQTRPPPTLRATVVRDEPPLARRGALRCPVMLGVTRMVVLLSLYRHTLHRPPAPVPSLASCRLGQSGSHRRPTLVPSIRVTGDFAYRPRCQLVAALSQVTPTRMSGPSAVTDRRACADSPHVDPLPQRPAGRRFASGAGRLRTLHSKSVQTGPGRPAIARP
jgi:hypothetical protein